MALIRNRNEQRGAKFCVALGIGVLSLFTVANAVAQDRGDDRGYGDRDRIARLDPGTTVPVRVNESIDVDKGDNRVYTGTVDADVRGDNGRVIVPRGANVELMVRYSRDNDLNLDLESILVNGQRYAVRTDPQHYDAQRDNSLVGSIVGAINGGEAVGRAVRIPRDSVVTFRLARPLDVGVADRGEDRGGYHYHDWYGNEGR